MANLFYIIGGSGAGKDSLIDYLQKHLPEKAPIKIVQRYITRPEDAGGENHISLSEKEFLNMKELDCFCMDWFSHDTYYGIGTEVKNWMYAGYSVIVNGSRGYLQDAIKIFPNIVPVLISVDPVILSERLFSRGRENYNEIQKRVAQAIRLDRNISHANLQIIDNNGSLEDSGENLIRLIKNNIQFKCA